MNPKIRNFIEAFQEKFQDFLTIPNVSSIYPEDHARAVIEHGHMILPAQKSFLTGICIAMLMVRK